MRGCVGAWVRTKVRWDGRTVWPFPGCIARERDWEGVKGCKSVVAEERERRMEKERRDRKGSGESDRRREKERERACLYAST